MGVTPSISLFRLLFGTALVLLGWVLASTTSAYADDVVETTLTASTAPVTATVDTVREPVIKAAEPVVEVAEPVAKAAEPVVKAVEPVAKPVVKAVEPVAKPVAEPVVKAVEPVAKPVVKAVEPLVDAALAPVVETLAPGQPALVLHVIAVPDAGHDLAAGADHSAAPSAQVAPLAFVDQAGALRAATMERQSADETRSELSFSSQVFAGDSLRTSASANSAGAARPAPHPSAPGMPTSGVLAGTGATGSGGSTVLHPATVTSTLVSAPRSSHNVHPCTLPLVSGYDSDPGSRPD